MRDRWWWLPMIAAVGGVVGSVAVLVVKAIT